MLSQDQFSIRWQRSHHFPMDLSGDTAFYHEVYDQLKGLTAGRNVGPNDETCLFRLLLYTENCVAIGLDNVYERMYRRLGDAVAYWCERMEVKGREASRVHYCLSRAVANAPESSLRQWLKESILSHDFHRLREVALFFARYDHTLRVVYPILRYRKALFRQLAGGDKTIAAQMLWADLAFNWRDKYGHTLLSRLAERFDQMNGTTDIAHDLRSIRSCHLQAYLPVEDEQHRCLIAQQVTYLGTTYINGPAIWLPATAYTSWNNASVWRDILKQEQDAARQVSFTTPFGKRVSLYDDLYVIPEDPEEARLSDMGIYPDEPSILDFLEWMRPAGTASKAADPHVSINNMPEERNP